MVGARCPYRDPSFYNGNVSLQYIHLLADIALLIIPALQVQKLRLNRAKKLGLTALFMFGIFVCAATIAVIVYSTKYDPSTSDEFSWSVASIFIWTIAEVNLAIASSELHRPASLCVLLILSLLQLVFLSCALFSSRSVGTHPKSREGRLDYQRYLAINGRI